MFSGFSFSLLNEEQFDQLIENSSQEPSEQQNENNSLNYCSECDIEMEYFTSNVAYLCPKCGYLRNVIGYEFDEIGSISKLNYNTSNTSSVQLKIQGPNAYKYQRKLMCNTSDYSKTQRRDTQRQLQKCMYEHDGPQIPDNVVLNAANLYVDTVQSHSIKRGRVRTGILAACLYYECIRANMSRKPKEIAEIMGIETSDLSNGDKFLQDLYSKGLIDIPVNVDPVRDLIDRYFECLNISNNNDNYKEFIVDLINFTQKEHIAKKSIKSSKCAGAIYILTLKEPSLQKITKNQIREECNISISTFTRFSREILMILDDNISRRSRSSSSTNKQHILNNFESSSEKEKTIAKKEKIISKKEKTITKKEKTKKISSNHKKLKAKLIQIFAKHNIPI